MTKRAHEHTAKPAKTLPKNERLALPGAVVTVYKRCGKPRCRCQNPQNRHGPYHYRVWRVNGTQRKCYVKPRDLARVRAACARWKTEEGYLREMLREGRRSYRALLKDLRAYGW